MVEPYKKSVSWCYSEVFKKWYQEQRDELWEEDWPLGTVVVGENPGVDLIDASRYEWS